jgi:putative NIF3 family GTP cyclohydrolase 1 type 2
MKTMNVEQIYKEIVNAGIDADPRSRDDIDARLKKLNREYRALPRNRRQCFDVDRLWNPFDDTRFLTGDPDACVKKIMVGVDIDTAELLLIDRLNERGAGIDLVISHHPTGRGLVSLAGVIKMQSEMLRQTGIPAELSEALIGPRQQQVERSLAGGNFLKTVMAARNLGLNMICAHTAADNLAYRTLEAVIDKKRPKTLEKTVDLLSTIPEYREYSRQGCPVRIVNGKPSDKVNNIIYEFTGGTEGAVEAYMALAARGVDTVISMHQSDAHFNAAKAAGLKVILAGHMASDILGLNALLDKVLKDSDIKVSGCSGFIRIKR